MVISHCAFLHDGPLSDDPSGKSGLFLKVHFNLPLGIFYFSLYGTYIKTISEFGSKKSMDSCQLPRGTQ